MRPRLVGLGEVLWDLLPGGRKLGGAPANFAYHAAALGADSHVVSRVGRDAAGHDLLQRLVELGLPTDGIETDPTAPTGTVGVEMGADGHPVYTIHENVAWDRLSGETVGRRAVASADAVCVGTLAQRGDVSRRTIRGLLSSTKPGALRVFDVNLRQHFHSKEVIEETLGITNILKVNESELPRIADLFDINGDDRVRIHQLALRFDLRAVAFTRGERGSLIYSEGRWSELPGKPIRIVDTVGAGDSFTAAMTLGLLAGWDLDEVHVMAASVATHVCSQPGATPPMPSEFRRRFESGFRIA
ncbi:MAG: carbohydrate kinase [Limisphaerales bacterium]